MLMRKQSRLVKGAIIAIIGLVLFQNLNAIAIVLFSLSAAILVFLAGSIAGTLLVVKVGLFLGVIKR